MNTAPNNAKAICRRCIEIMVDGSIEDFEPLVHPDAVNREADTAPPACRGRGPRAYHAAALMLRDAFADLQWTVHEVIAEGDLVSLHCTMSGRHVRTFCSYREDGRVSMAFPPTRKRFSVTQTQWYRIADGKIVEYWANRDDLGMAMQLGWMPTPGYLVWMILATFRARRSDRAAGRE